MSPRYVYCYGTNYAPAADVFGWVFGFAGGSQSLSFLPEAHYAWAVRPGDIAPVPVPAAAWLFGAGLGVMGGLKRSRAA